MSTATLEPQTGPSPEELKLGRRHSRKAGLFDPELMKTAFWQSLVMLRPDIQWKNPVMFTVEVGTVLTLIYTVAKMAGHGQRRQLGLPAGPGLLAHRHAPVRQLRLGHRRGPRQGPGRRPAEDPPGHARPAAAATDGTYEETVSTELEGGRHGRGRRGRNHPQRRRDHRRRGLDRRVGHHGRIGPRDPRGGRRPLRRHRRHPRPLRPHRGRNHRRRRPIVPRPHDRPGGRRHPPADAQRDRALASCSPRSR